MGELAAKRRQLRRHAAWFLLSLAVLALLFAALFSITAHAAGPRIDINLDAGEAEGSLGTLDLLFLMVVLAMAPSILIMMTSFTRIVIVLSFLRNALGTQQSPPNQVLIGMALFLSLFIMSPVLGEINEQAIQPYREGTLTQEEALERMQVPLKTFMIKQTYTDDLNLFLSISKTDQVFAEVGSQTPEELTQLGLEVVVPAFVTSELKHAFTIGFLLFIPFLIIDMVVSSTLMSMGMVMLPPSMISLPFKIMMFVLVDGWGLLFGTLVQGFR